MKKKSLYIHGSFMNDNFGDFLLYYVVAKYMEQQHPEVKVVSSNISDTYDEFININRVSKLNGFLKSDGILLAGGGYFSQNPTRTNLWNLRFLFKHGLPLLSLGLIKKKYSIIGVGAGPLSNAINRFLTKHIFENGELVSVRDNESKDFLKGIGVSRNVEVTPDWVMGMDKSMLLGTKNLALDFLSQFSYDEIVYVHLTTKKDDKGSGMEAVISDLIEYSNQHPKTLFIVGCDQKRESQEIRAKETVSRFTNGRAVFLPYKGPFFLSNIINSSDVVVTDKLHVGIVGVKLEKYVVSVAYHTKTKRFYNMMKIPKQSKRLNSIQHGDVLNMLADRKVSSENVNYFIQKSKNNFKLLDDFVSKL